MLRPLVRPLVRALTRSPMESRGLRPTLSLDFTNGGVTDSRVTYSGGANGTRVNSAGLIVAATTPRFDYNPVTLAPLGLLVEEARTNLAVRSAEFDNASWAKTGTATVTPNTNIAPDGTLSADTLNMPASGDRINLAPIGVTGGSTVTATLWMSGSGTTYLSLATSGGTYKFGGTLVTLTATPTRHQVTLVTNADNTAVFPVIGRYNGAVGAGTATAAVIWGYQFEVGSFPTSYDPTTSAALTRTADSGILSGAAFTSIYNQAGGSAVVQFDLIAVSGTRPIISFDDNTANERIELYATGTDLRMRVVDGGATQVDMSIGTVAANATYKAAIAWAANDFAGCLNGGTVATDSSGTLPTPDRLRIGSDQAGNFQCGHDKTLQAFALRLPNATLQGMTA